MKFDVILPSIGRLTLGHAAKSVIAQEYPHWNLHISLDGLASCDLDLKDDRIKIYGSDLKRQEDFGAWARNRAIAEGNNPWIAYIDDDDTWYPNHLSEIFALLSASPDATMIRTAGQSFSWRRKSPRTKNRVYKLGAVNNTDILTVGMAHTRELFQLTSGWKPEDNHDRALWHEMLSQGGRAVESQQVTFLFER